MLRYQFRNNIILLSAIFLAGAVFADSSEIIWKGLKNRSAFKEKQDWQISAELTNDIKTSLRNQGFRIIEYRDVKTFNNEPVVEGNINIFTIKQIQMDSMPMVSYKTYEAKIIVTMVLIDRAGKKHEIRSEYTANSNKLRSMLPGPDEAEIANDKIADFETRESVKWGDKEFAISVVGIARDKVVSDIVNKVVEELK